MKTARQWHRKVSRKPEMKDGKRVGWKPVPGRVPFKVWARENLGEWKERAYSPKLRRILQ